MIDHKMHGAVQYPGQRSVPLFATFIAVCLVLALSGVAQAQIVAFGASNVAGRGVFPNQAWPAQLEILLKEQGYNVHVKNAGISGDTTKHMLQRVDSAIPDGTKIVILDIGGGFFNNSKAGVPRAQGQADMKALAARIKARGITIVPENTSTMSTTYKQPDRIHLTAKGHRLFAQQLLPRVISALGGSHSG
jgi:acyl-CoA thioesterase-1